MLILWFANNIDQPLTFTAETPILVIISHSKFLKLKFSKPRVSAFFDTNCFNERPERPTKAAPNSGTTLEVAWNAVLITRTLQSVTAADRGDKTGFLARSLTETMPKLTRKIEVVLQMIRTTNLYSFACADNLLPVLRSY